MPIDVGALVMVTENDGALAELCASRANAFVGVAVGESVETIEADGGGLHGADFTAAASIRRDEQLGIARLNASADQRQPLSGRSRGRVCGREQDSGVLSVMLTV